MKLPTILQLAKSGEMVQFLRYEDRRLWYSATYHEVDADGLHEVCTFDFPVPIHDTEGGVFLHQDKPTFFMRWMRAHLEYLQFALDTLAGNKPPPYPAPDLDAVGPGSAQSRGVSLPWGAPIK